MLLSLQDDAQEQLENLQVYLRVRPFTATESSSGEAQVTHTHTHTHCSVLQLLSPTLGVYSRDQWINTSSVFLTKEHAGCHSVKNRGLM